MATTQYLQATKIETQQSQKEVTANAAFDIFDKAIAGRLSKAITSADVTLSTDEARHAVIELTGTLTGNRNLIVPASSKFYLIQNLTSGAFTVTVKTPAGTGVVVAQGKRAFLYSDATNVVTSLSDLPGFAQVSGTPADDQIAVWTGASSLEGVSGFSFASGKLKVPTSFQIGTPDTQNTPGVSVDIDRIRFRESSNYYSSLRLVTGTYDLQAWNENTGSGANFQADRFVGNYLYTPGGYRTAAIENGTLRLGFPGGDYATAPLEVDGPRITSNHVARFSTNHVGSLAVLIDLLVGQTADAISVRDSTFAQIFGVNKDGKLRYVSGNTATTVGAAGGASALPATPTGYLQVVIGGTTYKIPYYAN